MPSTINATSTGSGGLISTGDASGQLELQTNSSTRLTINSSGNATFAGNLTVNGTLSATSGLPSLATPLAVVGNATAGSEIRLPEDTDNGSNYVALKAADNLASNVTFTLPSADGTNGQVLQTNGSGTLSFATPAGGSWTYLSTVTASNSATMDLETTIDSTYDVYAIVLSGLVPQNNGITLRARYKISGSYSTANYECIQQEGGAAGWGGSTGTAALEILTNVGNSSGYTSSAIVYLNYPSSTTLRKVIYGNGAIITGAGTSRISIFAGHNTSTSAVTGIQFYFSTGNVTSGTARLYGIKNS